MTSEQNLLLPYVESRVKTIIEKKAEENKVPLISTYVEIIKPICNDVLECMRELHQSGKYKGTNTLNQPALIKNI